MRHLLLLGGTSEARALARELAGSMSGSLAGSVAGAMTGGPSGDTSVLQRWRVTASLAGVTRKPLDYGVPTRSGGFGGVSGLRDYLLAEKVAAVIDATHPFAAAMPANAAQAADQAGIPRLRLLRPEWQPDPVDRWLRVPDLRAAADALPSGARGFLALGAGAAQAFAHRGDVALLLRVIEPPAEPPPGLRILLARPPFTEAEETAQLRDFKATHLVTKNAGGASGRAKLVAAAQLGLTVVMVDRPASPMSEVVATVQAALEWLRALR